MSLFSLKPFVLYSDILIFILVLSLIAFFYQLYRNPLSRASWQKVFHTPIGLSSFTVIVFYILIALLDSLHFQEPLAPVEGQQETQYSQTVHSVLDVLLRDLHQQGEKTYSAPFSLHSFAKENMQDAQGQVYRDYPRLVAKATHVATEQEKQQDVFYRMLKAVAQSLAFCLVLIGLHRFWCKKQGHSSVPWWSLYLTLSLLIIASYLALELSRYYHIAGTNIVGQDVFYLSLKAVRTGVLIGTLATLLTLPLAIVLGISAGYFKGWVDDIVQYIYTTLSSIPGILLIAASVLLIDVYIQTHAEQFPLSIQRADFKFLALCFILGMTSWTGLCRLLRAETLKLSQLDYVQAAHAFGVSHARIIFRHILPNASHIILISLVLDFSGFVLAEAVLSYIGVGVDASMASWGNMINDARAELSREPVVWWTVLSAFAFMFLLVLAANLFSDRVRDAFDPRFK